MSGFFDALSLLTRIPTRGGKDTSRAIPWIPVVGALVGAAAGAVYLGARAALEPAVAATLAIATGVLLTGALHEDGFADVADAFGARADRARTLEILKDPRHGTYGVLAIVLSIAARISAVASMRAWTGFGALVAAHALARAATVGTMAWLEPALGSTLGAAYEPGAGSMVAIAIGVAAALGMLGAWAIPAIGIAVVAALAVGVMARRAIGGYSGDVLGTVEQLVEIGVLLLAAGARHAVPWWHA